MAKSVEARNNEERLASIADISELVTLAIRDPSQLSLEMLQMMAKLGNGQPVPMVPHQENIVLTPFDHILTTVTSEESRDLAIIGYPRNGNREPELLHKSISSVNEFWQTDVAPKQLGLKKIDSINFVQFVEGSAIPACVVNKENPDECRCKWDLWEFKPATVHPGLRNITDAVFWKDSRKSYCALSAKDNEDSPYAVFVFESGRYGSGEPAVAAYVIARNRVLNPTILGVYGNQVCVFEHTHIRRMGTVHFGEWSSGSIGVRKPKPHEIGFHDGQLFFIEHTRDGNKVYVHSNQYRSYLISGLHEPNLAACTHKEHMYYVKTTGGGFRIYDYYNKKFESESAQINLRNCHISRLHVLGNGDIAAVKRDDQCNSVTIFHFDSDGKLHGQASISGFPQTHVFAHNLLVWDSENGMFMFTNDQLRHGLCES